MRQDEHHLQVACIKYYRLCYPKTERCLFAIPNGGARNKATAGELKAEGVLAGVADLFLARPGLNKHGHFIEMKIPGGKQTLSQRTFERTVVAQGYAYVVIRTIDDFITYVDEVERDLGVEK